MGILLAIFAAEFSNPEYNQEKCSPPVFARFFYVFHVSYFVFVVNMIYDWFIRDTVPVRTDFSIPVS